MPWTLVALEAERATSLFVERRAEKRLAAVVARLGDALGRVTRAPERDSRPGWD